MTDDEFADATRGEILMIEREDESLGFMTLIDSGHVIVRNSLHGRDTFEILSGDTLDCALDWVKRNPDGVELSQVNYN